MKKLLFYCLLTVLTCGVGSTVAQAQQLNYAIVEQNGLYYAVSPIDSCAYLIQADQALYYLEHNGDFSGYDYNAQYEIPAAYRGNVTVPATITYQGGAYPITSIDGFSNNPYVTSLRIEADLTSFYISYAVNLTSLELVNTSNLRSLSVYSTGLTSLTIPASVTSFNANGNTKLTHIEVAPGNTVYQMKQGVLVYYDTNLCYVPEGMEGTLVIPEGVINCYYTVLQNCTKITEVVVPSTFQVYNLSSLFYGTKDLKVTFTGENPQAKYIDGGFIIDNDGNLLYFLGSDAEELTVPEGIKSLPYMGSSTFPNLKILNLPASFTQESVSNIHYFYKLQRVNVAAGNKNLCSVDGLLMDKTKETLLCVPNNYQGETLIPAGTKTIGQSAFQNCSCVTRIDIPNTVSSIQYGAFSACYNLNYVSLPASIEKMGESVFSSCTKLETVAMDQSLKILGGSMFTGCTSLKSLTLPDVTLIPNSFLNGCISLESITIPSTVTGIGAYAFAYCAKLKEIKLPASLQTIGSYAFQNDSALTSLTIPASVTSIGQSITQYCPQLDKITVEAGNNTYCDIDGVIFSADKKNLIQFPAGRKGSYTIPTGTSVIGQYAFYQCDSLKKVIVPEGVTQLEQYAFGYLPGIEELDLPTTLSQFIGSSLYELNNLKRLIVRTSEKITSYYNLTGYLSPRNTCVVYVHENNYDNFKGLSSITSSSSSKDSSTSKFAVIALGKPYGIGLIRQYLKGISVVVVENELESIEKNLVSVKVGDATAVKQEDGTYLVTGLKTSTQYNLVLTYRIGEKTGSITRDNLRTNNISYRVKCSNTQTTITLTSCEFRSYTDITATPIKKTVTIQDQEYDCTEKLGFTLPYVITGLPACSSLPVSLCITYQDGEEVKVNTSISTQGFNARLIDYQVTPTTLRLNYTYNEIDAVPDSILLVTEDRIKSGYSYKYVHDTLRTSVKENLFTGLTPGKEYTVSAVYLKCKGNSVLNYNNSISNYYSVISKFTTPALTITTETPKVPERGRAIVSAKTNAGDGEGHVGFQWIKYNAPSTMQPYEAYGQVFEGTAQGQLKNLSTSSFYKVRAFYDAADGTRIYATNGVDNGWVTFDPDEASTFEAVVHTYADVKPTNTTVLLTGVMIVGSEAIIKQGFEYWEVIANETRTDTRMARRIGARRDVFASEYNNTQRIYIGGDNLTAELTGLIPGTDYAFRAFAETASGTIYGEERTFKTNGERPTTIEEIVHEKTESEVFHIYSVSGAMVRPNATSLEGLPRGLYIVNKRKVFVK